jgi:sugar lactone lactonase YvrE
LIIREAVGHPARVAAGTRVLADGFGFLESPRWHAGELWFSDFFSRRVQSVDESGAVTVRGYVPGQPSGLGFLPDGSALVASTYGRELLRLAGRRTSVVASTLTVFPGALNDLVVDAAGRAYVSPLSGPGGSSDTPLLFFDGATVRVLDLGLAGPNGLVLSADEAELIVAETDAARLTAFDVAPDGGLSGRRVFADLGGLAPDGLCLDPGGNVWVGCVFAEQFVRVAPDGSITERIPVPGRWAVAPALGGPDGDVLYCLTARTSLGRFLRGEGTSAIEVCDVAVPGLRPSLPPPQ